MSGTPSLSSLRLGYLVPEFPAQTHAFFWREIRAMRDLGVEVALLSTRRPPAGSCPHAFEQEAREQTRYLYPPRLIASLLLLIRDPRASVRAIRYVLGLDETPLARRLFLLGLLLPAADLLRYSRELRLDHIHAHSCAMSAHVVALCRLLGGPAFSLTLHGDLAVYGVDHGSKMRHARFVTTVTNALRSELIQSVGLPPDKVFVITMGVDTDVFAPIQSPSTQKELHAATIARLNFMKGHRFALRAIEAGRRDGLELRYSIAGEGPEQPAIEREIANLGIEAHVALLGPISESAVVELLQRIDVLLQPSTGLGEAAPVAVMEAMSCGVPVVASRIGGTPEMIEDGVDGFLVEREKPEAILDVFHRLARDPDLRLQVGRAARSKAVERFDYRAIARRFVERIQTSD